MPSPRTLLARLVTCSLMLPMAACAGDSNVPRAPFAPGSPWPKFRHDEAQTGRSSVRPRRVEGAVPWVFQTGKGIFSSPVVDANENVYVGSADRNFYSIDARGNERWRVVTGEIIDSSGLLDDRGLVYFGSGDGYLRAIDTATGAEAWRFQANDPSVNGSFIRWFEGNVAMGVDGTLYAPNDNFDLYAIDRDTHLAVWRYELPDQTWSLPAVDVVSGRLFLGNNNLLPALGHNFFGLSSEGQLQFGGSSLGTIAASPVFVRDPGLMIMGGFDGYLRAYTTEGVYAGDPVWEYASRDHIYSSPALDSRGRIIQPGADGTVVAVDARTGTVAWRFDARDPFRSSPAVDGDDNVYVGGGDGRLYVLNPDGTLRYRMLLIAGERNDLNSSPALGRNGAYVGGENGGVYFVPYDYCLGAAGMADPRCEGPTVGEGLPSEGAFVYFTTQLGDPLETPPTAVGARQPLPFSLFVRAAGDTTLALIDEAKLAVDVTPPSAVTVVVSPDRRFLTVIPEAPLTEGGDGKVHVRVHGDYLVDPMRTGLRMVGGTRGGSFDRTFDFDVHAPSATASPFTVPSAPATPTSAFELRRVAAPLPTILPSYNQIGFDSLYFVGGIVEGTPTRSVAWIVGGLPDANGDAVVDPASRSYFPVELSFDGGDLVLENQGAFALEAYTLRLTFDRFRFSARLDDAGRTLETPTLFVSTVCSGVQTYGAFLSMLGFCNPATDSLSATGAALYQPLGSTGLAQPPTGLGAVVLAYDATAKAFTATVAGGTLLAADHSISLLVVDAATGRPVLLDYGTRTSTTATSAGALSGVTLDLATSTVPLPASVRLHLLIDVVPMATSTLAVP